MRIDRVHVRKLVSGPGYNNHSVEAEAIVEDGETPESVVDNLGLWVDDQIKRARNAGEMRESLAELIYEVGTLQKREQSLRAQISELEAARFQLSLGKEPDNDTLPF